MLKVATFNTNSIRARIEIIKDWLRKHNPDVLAIQETKVQDKDFPEEIIKEEGYNCVFKGQKSYNGVAIISKFPVENVSTGFDGKGGDEGSRLMSGKINNINIVNTYIPQGFEPGTEKFRYKLDWLRRILEYFQKNYKPEDPLVWLGDFNVAPEDIDVYDPVKLKDHTGFHPQEKEGLEKVRKWGFTDVFRLHEKRENQYTFYDYRIPGGIKRKMGWRLDHIWATEAMAEKSIKAYIDMEPRLKEKPSDHTFLVAEFDL